MNFFGYKIVSALNPEIQDKIIDDEFGTIYQKCRNFTMTSKERMYALYKAVEYVVNAKILGDFVECGVWKGGSAMVIAYTLIQMEEKDRRIFLYDTYLGMEEPTEADRSISDDTPAIEQWKKRRNRSQSNWCFASLSDVRNNMLSTGYPEDHLFFVKGRVQDTVPESSPSQIALLRLDTDWYESTKHELIHLYPPLTKYGILIIDDYGYWSGSKKAVDEYFSNTPILLNRIDNTGRIGTKLV